MRLIYLFLTILILGSCGTKARLKKENLKDYFPKIEDFETPKVLIYELDSIGKKSHVYYLIERKGETELFIIKFNAQFIQTEHQLVEFKDDGVYLKEAFIVEDFESNLLTKIEVKNNMVFPFDPSLAVNSYERSIQFQMDTAVIYKMVTDWQFEELTTKYIVDSKKKTIIARGTHRTREIFTDWNSDGEIEGVLELWYTKGLGMTKAMLSYGKDHFSETYIETISVGAFEELKTH
jgi:hypothetical protein